MGLKLDAVVKSLNKEAKEELIHKGLSAYDYTRIPFTSPRLNYMTFGGLPMGKLIEFFGENHGGKTSSSLDIVANYQNMERKKAEADPTYEPKTVCYADIENTLDVVYSKRLGVDVDNLLIYNPTGQGSETIFEQLITLLETGEIGLMVIDSFGAMMSNQAFEKSIEEKTYGGISLSLTNFAKRAEMLCHKYNCTIIGINQNRAKINSPYGGMTTVGGEGWKYLCSVRLEFRMGKYFDENGKDLTRGAENPSGNYVLVEMVKNKTCPPTRRTGFYTLNYLKGIDYLKDLTEVAMKFNLVIKDGSWFSVVDAESGEQLIKVQGITKVYDYLEENEDALKKIEDYIDSQISNRDNLDLDPSKNAELSQDNEEVTQEPKEEAEEVPTRGRRKKVD